MAQWVKGLLCNHEDMSLDLKCQWEVSSMGSSEGL